MLQKIAGGHVDILHCSFLLGFFAEAYMFSLRLASCPHIHGVLFHQGLIQNFHEEGG